MRAKEKRAKAIRLFRYAAMIALVGGTVAAITLWLVFQHKPDWYAPTSIEPDRRREIRVRLADVADDISHRMVKGDSFELTFTDETINQWLAALPYVWPDAKRAVPSELSDLMVRFEPERIRIGSLYTDGGWRAILSVAVELGVSGDGKSLDLKLAEAHGGSLPIPRAILQRILDELSGSVGNTPGRTSDRQRRTHSVDPASLLNGTAIPNRFVWPNGDRPFRIEILALTKGRIRLNLEPL